MCGGGRDEKNKNDRFICRYLAKPYYAYSVGEDKKKKTRREREREKKVRQSFLLQSPGDGHRPHRGFDTIENA